MRVGSWPLLGQRACGIADGNLDLGRSCGGIAHVGWRNLTGFADAIALAWCLSYFGSDLSQNPAALCAFGFTELALGVCYGWWWACRFQLASCLCGAIYDRGQSRHYARGDSGGCYGAWLADLSNPHWLAAIFWPLFIADRYFGSG